MKGEVFQLPEWLTLESLGKMIVAENDSPSFSRIPKHFIEMAHTILYYFKDDIVNGDQVLCFFQKLFSLWRGFSVTWFFFMC